MPDQDKPESPSFEALLARLEAIVAEMEGGKLPLDESIRRFEEGMACARTCAAKLGEAEKKIEILLRRPDGTVEWADLPEGQRRTAGDGTDDEAR